MVQILHRGSADSGHWFTISTLNCNVGTIKIFDSAFNDIDKESKSQIASILKFDGKCLKLQKVPVQHQAGGSECGLFVIAFAVALSVKTDFLNRVKWETIFSIAWKKTRLILFYGELIENLT